MVPIVKKRPRIEANFGHRKRLKHDQRDTRPSPNSSTQPVSLDTLPWQEVAFPESGFEDAEGFFGLEEISDVEVVKDPKLGKVEYRVCQLHLSFIYQTTNCAVKITSDSSRSKPQELSNHLAEANHTKDTTAWRITTEDDQWEGFEELDKAEDKDANQAPEMTDAGRDASNIKLKPKKRRNKGCKDVVPKQDSSKALDNPFDALAEVNDNLNDAVDEIDGKQVRVSIGDSAY